MTMLPQHRLYRNDIDSIVGLLIIRQRLTAGRTRIRAKESLFVLFKNRFTRYVARTFDSGGIHTCLHTFTYSIANAHTYICIVIRAQSSHRVNDTRYSLWRAGRAKIAKSLDRVQPRVTTTGPAVWKFLKCH